MKALKRIVWFVVLVSCTSTTVSSGTDYTALKKRSETFAWNLFRHFNKSCFDALSGMKDVDPATLRRLPVFDSLFVFLDKEQDAYVAVRQADLQRYPAPPASLPGYVKVEPDNTKEYLDAMILKDSTILPFYSLRSYGPRELISQLLLPMQTMILYSSDSNNTASSIRVQEYLNNYFGERIYAKKLQGDVWDILMTAHVFAWHFQWDIRHNKIAGIRILRYTGARNHHPLQEVPYNIKPIDEMTALTDEISTFRWKQYTALPVQDEELQAWATAFDKNTQPIAQQAAGFVKEHHAQYEKIRLQWLRNYATWPPSMEGYTSVHQPELAEVMNSLTNDSLHLNPVINLRALGGESIASTISMHSLRLMYNEGEEPPAVREMSINYGANWLMGLKIYTREIKAGQWEVCYMGRIYAYRFIWDIKEDTVSGIQYWRNDPMIRQLQS